MDLVYFFAVATWVMSSTESPKGPPTPDVPFNIGYISIFLCLMVMFMTTVFFIITHKAGEKVPAMHWIITIAFILGSGYGMSVGYDYHVQFLDNWYSTH
jgi:hypothetical protein